MRCDKQILYNQFNRYHNTEHQSSSILITLQGIQRLCEMTQCLYTFVQYLQVHKSHSNTRADFTTKVTTT